MLSLMKELSEDYQLGSFTSVPKAEETEQLDIPDGFCGKEVLI